MAQPVSVAVPTSDISPFLQVTSTPLFPPRPSCNCSRFFPLTSTVMFPLSPALTIGTGASGVGAPSCVLFPNTLSPRNGRPSVASLMMIVVPEATASISLGPRRIRYNRPESKPIYPIPVIMSCFNSFILTT